MEVPTKGADREVDDAEDARRREEIRVAAERPGSREEGAAFYTPRSSGPWYSGDSGALRAPATELRARALDANEKTERMPDVCRERMATELEADPDPEARLARYTLEASNPDYFRAFTKWFNDPVSGGHEWSPAEREAVARVRMLERALGLGTQGGGFMTPYELDPAILVSSAGTRSPLREIARVDTTAFNTKKYVTSAGVTASWTPEATQQTDDSPTLLQPSIDTKKGAAFCPVSFELYEDSNIAQEVGALFADAKANQENLSFTLTQTNGPDRYGHLMPGTEEEAAALLDSYLHAQQRRAEEAARSAGGVHGECLTGELTGEQIGTEDRETA
jgi:HK97 family phage major capsid protein